MKRSLSLIVLLAACDSDPADPATTSTATTADTTITDTGDDAETNVDTAVGDTVVDVDLGPPPEPVTGDLTLDWAIQSDSLGGSTLYPSFAALDDGGVAIIAGFDQTVTFGGKTVVAPDDEKYHHALYARVTGSGEVAALTNPCSGCIGLGGSPLTALSGQRVAFAGVSDEALSLTILAADGTIEATKVIATGEYMEPRALIATAEGFVVAGNHSRAFTVTGGPTFGDAEDAFFPGLAFVIGVDHALVPRFADALDGAAGSTIGMLHQDGTRLVAVGDFGGYPAGAEAIFGKGTADELALESVSSDDDPAVDIFVATWDLATLNDKRPKVAWARRIAHYSNGPRSPTFLRASGDDLEFLIGGAEHIDPDGEHYTIGYPEDQSLVVRFDRDGVLVADDVVPTRLVPRPGGFASLTTPWAGSTVTIGDDGPSFSVPAYEPGADVAYSGHVIADFRADRALVQAGMLLVTSDPSQYPVSPHALFPQADGSSLLLLHGSTPVTLVPDAGPEVSLPRSPESAYERLIVLRARVTP